MSERLAEADWEKTSASQEAPFYPATIAAFAANNEQEVQRAERARISELANHMSCADERRSKDRKLTRLNDSLALQTMTY